LDTAATDNFVNEFKQNKTLYTNMKGKVVALGALPSGVDSLDQRVKEIIEECKKRNNGNSH